MHKSCLDCKRGTETIITNDNTRSGGVYTFKREETIFTLIKQIKWSFLKHDLITMFAQLR